MKTKIEALKLNKNKNFNYLQNKNITDRHPV